MANPYDKTRVMAIIAARAIGHWRAAELAIAGQPMLATDESAVYLEFARLGLADAWVEIRRDAQTAAGNAPNQYEVDMPPPPGMHKYGGTGWNGFLDDVSSSYDEAMDKAKTLAKDGLKGIGEAVGAGVGAVTSGFASSFAGMATLLVVIGGAVWFFGPAVKKMRKG